MRKAWLRVNGESRVLVCMDDVQAIAHNGEYLEVSYKAPARDSFEKILFDSPATARQALDELCLAMGIK